ncbi:MAG: helix-turn-helix transcriptional regulator [Chloroflexi bacterium]|nr:helix-turn-helix transcriptional regulator [Chloroflexota bacterium]
MEFRQLREDAGITQDAVSEAAGISASLESRIESADVAASLEAWIAIATAFGGDLSVRVYPNTGPPIRDRFQAPIVETLLRELHPRWRAIPEVVVRSPARGVIDVVLVDQAAGVLVGVEVHSQIHRLEQQLRWANENAASLPSSDLWALVSGDGRQQVSQLLLLRSTQATRALAATYPETFRGAPGGHHRSAGQPHYTATLVARGTGLGRRVLPGCAPDAADAARPQGAITPEAPLGRCASLNPPFPPDPGPRCPPHRPPRAPSSRRSGTTTSSPRSPACPRSLPSTFT